jgi:hypothetical protein
MITLCGRVTNIHMIAHETSTEEEFEVIKFIESSTHFPLLLGKTCIEKDHIRRKAEEEATEQKKQELRDLIARKLERLIEEQEDKSKQQKTRELAIEVDRTQKGLKDLSMKERKIPTLELIREEVLTLHPLKKHQPCEATMLRESKNKNGKMNPKIQIRGKKARKLSKKKTKLEKLREVTEKTSQEVGLKNLNLAGISRTTQNETSPRRSYMTVGGAPTIRMMLQNG